MRHIFWSLFAFVCMLNFAASVEPQRPNIEMVSWLAGSWKGEAFGGTAEEIWSQLVGGTMIGMFRLINKGKVESSEFQEIVEQDNLLISKVKYFTAAFVGWEEKEKSVDFKFLSSAENEIHFDGLTLTRIDDKTCKHTIKLLDNATGKTKDMEILYHREQN